MIQRVQETPGFGSGGSGLVEWEAGGWNESTLTKQSVKVLTSYWNGTFCIYQGHQLYCKSILRERFLLYPGNKSD